LPFHRAIITELSKAIGAPVPLARNANAAGSRTFYESLKGEQLRDGVSASSFLWSGSSPRETLGDDGSFSISLANKLTEAIRDPVVMILFYDNSGHVIDYTVLKYTGVLPPGIAKRVTGTVDPSTKQLTTPPAPMNQFMYDDRPKTKIEFR
jgi:hypothetical protein